MNTARINQILEIAPSKISFYATEENKHYADMINLHENYKRQRAKLALEQKAKGDEGTQKEKEYLLDTNEELNKIRDKELESEINYRAWRIKKNKAENLLQVALEMGRTKRSELKSLTDVVLKREEK